MRITAQILQDMSISVYLDQGFEVFTIRVKSDVVMIIYPQDSDKLLMKKDQII